MAFLKSILKYLAPTLLDWLVERVREYLKEQEKKRHQKLLDNLSRQLTLAKEKQDEIEIRNIRARIIGLQKQAENKL